MSDQPEILDYTNRGHSRRAIAKCVEKADKIEIYARDIIRDLAMVHSLEAVESIGGLSAAHGVYHDAKRLAHLVRTRAKELKEEPTNDQ